MSSRCRARASSRSCNSRSGATCAKRLFRAFDRARRQRRQDRQQGDHRRDGEAARRARPAARLHRLSPITGSTTRWRKRRRRCASLLDTVWAPARAQAVADRDALQALVQEEGGNFALAPGTGATTPRSCGRQRCDIDEAEIKPYLQLERMIEAAFYTAERLFGSALHRSAPMFRSGIPDVRVWEVRGRDGRRARAVLRRLFRPPVQAQRRLDDVAARPGEARRRQFGRSIVNVMQFRQGRRPASRRF